MAKSSNNSLNQGVMPLGKVDEFNSGHKKDWAFDRASIDGVSVCGVEQDVANDGDEHD